MADTNEASQMLGLPISRAAFNEWVDTYCKVDGKLPKEEKTDSAKGLHNDAWSMRPVRIVGDELHEYEDITFPDDPRAGIELCLRRIGTSLRDDGNGYQIDILDEAGDIIQDFPIDRWGMNYLRSRLKLRRVYRKIGG